MLSGAIWRMKGLVGSDDPLRSTERTRMRRFFSSISGTLCAVPYSYFRYCACVSLLVPIPYFANRFRSKHCLYRSYCDKTDETEWYATELQACVLAWTFQWVS